MDDLIKMCANGAQNSGEENESTLILPTSERQVRDLASLSPVKQAEVWMKAVEEAGNKVPSTRIVKNVIQSSRLRIQTPNPYRVGDVCQILVKENPDLRGRGGRMVCCRGSSQLLLSRQSVGWRATSSCPESQGFRILHTTTEKSSFFVRSPE